MDDPNVSWWFKHACSNLCWLELCLSKYLFVQTLLCLNLNISRSQLVPTLFVHTSFCPNFWWSKYLFVQTSVLSQTLFKQLKLMLTLWAFKCRKQKIKIQKEGKIVKNTWGPASSVSSLSCSLSNKSSWICFIQPLM